MSFNEYILVGESDIYDKQGFRKAIFLQMAGLTQTKEKLEDGSANPNLGWVVQTEKWIAERMGISESAVYKAIKTFVEDGWWVREELPRDSYGHRHCRWRLAEGAQERLRKAKRGKGPRVTNPKKANKQSFKPMGNSAPRVSDASNTRESLTPASLEALRLGADRRDGSDTEASRLGACNDVDLDVGLLLLDETIAIADASPDTDQEQETAGETPATPTLGSNSDSSSEAEFDESASGFGDPVSFTPAPAHDSAALPCLKVEPARWLANYLFCFLSVREDVAVLLGWEKFWTRDFQDALDSGWSVEDVARAIRASQVGRAREFYKRGASIVANLELLTENGQKLESKGLLCDFECPKCHGLFVGVEALVEHQLGCYEKPIDPGDVAEEEAMDLADEMVSEGYVKENPEMATYYPWTDDDRHMFDPWADVPELLPEPTGKQMPY